MKKYVLKPSAGGDPVEIVVERTTETDCECYSVRCADRPMTVESESLGPGAGWLRLRGRVMPFRAVRKDNTLQVWVAGRLYALDIVERTAQRSSAAAAAAMRADLAAPMPGTVLQISVKPGDAFEAHAPLVVMESMKMEMTLSAPHAGRVKEIRCKTGQLVEMGAVLVTFEEEGDAGPA